MLVCVNYFEEGSFMLIAGLFALDLEEKVVERGFAAQSDLELFKLPGV